MLGIDALELAVGGHDVSRQQGVDGQAVLADEIADAAAERDPADPDGTGVPEARRQAVGRGGRRVLHRGQSGLGPGRPTLDIDVERLHVAQIQHDAVVDDRVAGSAVAAAADREREAGVTRKRDHVGDVLGVGRPDDAHGPTIDPAGHDRPGLVVLVVVGRDHPAVDGSTQV